MAILMAGDRNFSNQVSQSRENPTTKPENLSFPFPMPNAPCPMPHAHFLASLTIHFQLLMI
ncbi:hypothetical protein H6G33_22485 [Calothrix sp. FACHB-1219]|uniref:hypothetical protein n=1 Tax=unclassified Calothrix TaxID=2619626 RepID=UPI00168276B1|nr:MULTISPECIES: hypothetical protein [unclassified Calothrix]MBD2200935.1 hypothetical protein [Calothrix sp. FACHB-168]MBD2219787.1 hypothetical protein [Calothrix sp. FACHB-1219]